MAHIIDGKAYAAQLKTALAKRVAALPAPPTLAVILAGDDPASLVYVGGKEKACQAVGMGFSFHHLPEDTAQEDLLALIDRLNSDATINGLLVQQPLPIHLDKHAVVARVAPEKDVDCLNPVNIGLLTAGRPGMLPCTPAAVIKLLALSGINPSGRHAVIVGRSDIVGKPLALLLLAQDATVTVCHSRTQNLRAECLRADILVAAAGKRNLITADMVKDGAAVIDVGITRLDGKRICGDADYPACKEKAAYITPVPGGVGPMTIAMLLENCLTAYEKQHG